MREKGDFLTLPHVIHFVAHQDHFQLRDRPGPFPGFWAIPDVRDPAHLTKKQIGDYLEQHLDTAVLTSVELTWGIEYLLDHYGTVFP